MCVLFQRTQKHRLADQFLSVLYQQNELITHLSRSVLVTIFSLLCVQANHICESQSEKERESNKFVAEKKFTKWHSNKKKTHAHRYVYTKFNDASAINIAFTVCCNPIDVVCWAEPHSRNYLFPKSMWLAQYTVHMEWRCNLVCGMYYKCEYFKFKKQKKKKLKNQMMKKKPVGYVHWTGNLRFMSFADWIHFHHCLCFYV